MKSKKIDLGQLKVTSFVTTVETEKVQTIKGGGTVLPYCQPTWDCPTCPPHGCGTGDTTPERGCGQGGTFQVCGSDQPGFCTGNNCLGEG